MVFSSPWSGQFWEDWSQQRGYQHVTGVNLVCREPSARLGSRVRRGCEDENMISDEKPEPKWKRFERAIHQIHEQFAPTNATVKYDDQIMGQHSHIERQIDVSIRIPVSGYQILIVVECKDHKGPIDVEDRGAFPNKVRDVRGNKGVMVSATGFTQAARNMAKTHGIDLRAYVDTESKDWPQLILAWLRTKFRIGNGKRLGVPANGSLAADYRNAGAKPTSRDLSDTCVSDLAILHSSRFITDVNMGVFGNRSLWGSLTRY